MKEETKRFYEFTFEQLVAALKLKGNFLTYDNSDSDGAKTSVLKIITVETKEHK